MKKNAVLVAIKTIINLLLPIITFPYIYRVLEVDNLGKYNFSASIVNYFVLLSGLGISTYAVREGAKIRDKRDEINVLCSELYLFNILSTVLSVILLVVLTFIIPKLFCYYVIIFILGLQIVFNTYGRNWIFNIFEDFKYITIVQLIFNFISVILLFLFVKSTNDLYIYTFVSIFSLIGANVFCAFKTKKYVSLKIVPLTNLKKHIKPILIIFSTTIATTIYVNSDNTILGWIKGDEAVGMYSVSVKIYSMIKQVIYAVILVAIPRLTMYSNSVNFKPLFKKILMTIVLISFPASVGLFMISKELIECYLGVEYVDATNSLRLLCIALVVALIACIFGMGVLLPYKKEMVFLCATSISSLVNILLNFILIPIYSYDAAAFTTIISQVIALIICFIYSRKYIDLSGVIKHTVLVLIGCLGIIITVCIISLFQLDPVVSLVLKVVLSIFVYFLVLLIFKNNLLIELINQIRYKILNFLK